MKKVVLITSAHFTTGSTGISQTLENLFDNYPASEMLIVSPSVVHGTFKNFRNIAYEGPYKKLFSNRFVPAKLKNFFIRKFWLSPAVNGIIKFAPDVIIIANLDKEPAIITKTVMSQIRTELIVYLLDNLVPAPDPELDTLYKGLMRKASKHIFISKYMAASNAEKYPEVRKWIVMHNPIEGSQISEKANVRPFQDQPVTIAYAGAIWPMHKDALMAFAQALQVIRKTTGMTINLVVYTAEHFHEMHKAEFEKWEITYGGFYPFRELKKFLGNHHALLVTSSFDKQFFDLSAYSVQTKVTDYLASGVPVIAIGPDFSACNLFIEENDCGFVIKTDQTEHIAESLKTYFVSDIGQIKTRAEKGLQLVKERYDKEQIQKELFSFINQA